MTAVATTTASVVGHQQPSSSTLSHSQSTRSNRSHSISASDRPTGDESDNDDEYDGEDDDEEGMMRGSEQGHDMISETTVKSGYLYKRGEKRKNWKKRWFVLRSAKLYYYKNEKEYQLLRFIDMAEVHTIAAVELKKAEHCFGISTSKRQYYVRASTSKEMQQWVDALRDVREQVRQRSTLTRDMAMVDIGSSGGENGPQTQKPLAKPPRSGSTSPMLHPVDRAAQGTASSSGKGSAPISIVIPGKGLYTSPAQPRITTGGMVISPLSATSESEAGGPGGAEQFGLSYTSSAGQSLASSPGRGGVLHHHHQPLLHQEAGGSSAAAEEGGEARSSRIMRRASGMREASVGSSTGEAASAASVAQPVIRRSSSQQPPAIQVQSQTQVMSSSDEDEGDGDEWDEDEEADRAMPLPSPGGLGLLSPHAAHAPPTKSLDGGKGQSSNDTILPAQPAKPKVAPEFFKDTSKVIHQGYLMKQSNRRKHWRKRWFVLTSSTLSYSRSHMDAKLARQIPLSSILDAIEYTSKKQGQMTGGAPLSPSLSGFGSGGAGLSFARSPLLGGGDSSTSTTEKRSSSLPPKTATSAAQPASSDVEQSNTTGGASSGNELETVTAASSSAAIERKVQVASNQPTAASSRAEERQHATAAPAAALSTPSKRKKENCFKIITPKRVYVVGAPTEEEELKWLSALQALLSHYHDQKDVAAVVAPSAQAGFRQQSDPTAGQPAGRTVRPANQDDTPPNPVPSEAV
jgi:hypothetical protein